MRVLVVDDHELNRSLLAELIASAGHEALVAATAEQAVLLATLQVCDLFLLDLNLPDLSGERLLPLLRELPGHDATPAWLATAAPEATRLDELLQLGFEGVLAKPIRLDALEQLLAEPRTRAHVQGATGIAPAVQPLLDDARGLLTCGSADLLARMRCLFIDELRDEVPKLLDALARGDLASGRQLLHRLQASTGFCGTPALGEACAALLTALQRGDDLARDTERLVASAGQTLEMLRQRDTRIGQD